MIRRTTLAALSALAGAVLTAAAWGQASPRLSTEAEENGPIAIGPGPENPLGRDSQAVQAGRALYLERCAVCHGQDATGSMAANLVRSRTVAHGTDGALYRVIVDGIPGTEMPPQPSLEPEQVWRIISYLHSLARPGFQPPVPGDVEAGRHVFEGAGCAGCHRIDGDGGFWGPPLDSIAARKTSEEIRRDVLEPSAIVRAGYRRVEVKTRNGERIAGMLKNEDTFSLQILTRDGGYRLLSRSDVAELRRADESEMPGGYGARLSEEQLQNLLAFLDRQRDPYITIDRGFQNY